ncbi:hypothetical protein AHAS_Ahas02G0205400 [Arachis hypogaea]
MRTLAIPLRSLPALHLHHCYENPHTIPLSEPSVAPSLSQPWHPQQIKNEFMMNWDGLRTKDKKHVLVLAATNRPFDLDEAVIRRLPKSVKDLVKMLHADAKEGLSAAEVLSKLVNLYYVKSGLYFICKCIALLFIKSSYLCVIYFINL